MNRKLALAFLLLLLPVVAEAQVQTDIRRIGGQAVLTAVCEDHASLQDVSISLASAATTQVVALTSGQVIYVCGYDFMAAGTVNVTFQQGTGTNCGTGTSAKSGSYPLVAQTGIARPNTGAVQWKVASGNALCITLSAAVQVSGILSYVKKTP